MGTWKRRPNEWTIRPEMAHQFHWKKASGRLFWNEKKNGGSRDPLSLADIGPIVSPYTTDTQSALSSTKWHANLFKFNHFFFELKIKRKNKIPNHYVTVLMRFMQMRTGRVPIDVTNRRCPFQSRDRSRHQPIPSSTRPIRSDQTANTSSPPGGTW